MRRAALLTIPCVLLSAFAAASTVPSAPVRDEARPVLVAQAGLPGPKLRAERVKVLPAAEGADFAPHWYPAADAKQR